MMSMDLEAILRDPGRQLEARALLRKELDASPSTLSYLKWQNKLPPEDGGRPIAILSSYTIETIAPFLSVESYVSGWRARPAFVQYSQWLNALLN